MSILNAFSRALDGLEKVLKALLVLIFIAMGTVAIVEVGRRYMLELSFQWADEFCRYMLVWMCFCGGSLALRADNLVRFDLGHDKLSERARMILELTVCLICLAFILFLFVRSYNWTFSFAAMRQRMLSLPLPMAAVFFSMPLGFGCMLLFLTEKVFKILRKLTEKKEQTQ